MNLSQNLTSSLPNLKVFFRLSYPFLLGFSLSFKYSGQELFALILSGTITTITTGYKE